MKKYRLAAVGAAWLALAVLIALRCVPSGTGAAVAPSGELTGQELADAVDRNSSMVSYAYMSPNADFPREGMIDKITVHHMAGDLRLDDLGKTFGRPERGASANYAIDSDGKVAMYVEERDRAWTSSSPENDHRAVTIEVANDVVGGTWHVSNEAFASLARLCADICVRNGIECLTWTGDASGNLTVHSMFNPGTDCPGPYLLSKMPELADTVNAMLDGTYVEPEPKPKLVALTFDDGPDGKHTSEIMDVLERYGVGATFFMVGENVSACPEAVKRAQASGFEIGSHSWDYDVLTDMPIEEAESRMAAADEAISGITGSVPMLFRPPSGHWSKALLDGSGKSFVLWSVDPRDWEIRNGHLVANFVKNRGDLSGQVILLHDVYGSTVDAVRELVPWLVAEGYGVVSVSELLESYYGTAPVAGEWYGYGYFSGT